MVVAGHYIRQRLGDLMDEVLIHRGQFGRCVTYVR